MSIFLQGTIGVFVFNCSSAHEALSDGVLNVNNMNAKPGSKQNGLHDTVIPNDIPHPQHSEIKDTHDHFQSMAFPSDHPDPELRGQPMSMLQVLRERESVWDRFTNGGRIEPVGTCKKCKLSAANGDALERVARAKEAGHEQHVSEQLDNMAEQSVSSEDNKWRCAKRVLSFQKDYIEESPLLQRRIEERRLECIFLPKFYCELDAIEM